MKTKLLRNFFFLFCAIIILSLVSKKINAINVYAVDMNNADTLDTIYICDTYDSIKFIHCSSTLNNMIWYISEDVYPFNRYEKYIDTLYLPNNFSGRVFCVEKGATWSRNWTEIKPIVLIGENITGNCGRLIQSNVITNYVSADNIFKWAPSTDLSNSNIQNPTFLLNKNVKYTLTINYPNGCAVSKTFNAILKPLNSPSICLVSVNNINKNIIYWEREFTNSIDSFLIYKETNVTNVYKKIGSSGYNDINYFIDTASFPLIQSNKYKISLKDTCDFESEKSIAHKTIHLTINQGLNNSWNLIWEPYVGFEVSTYYIYRGTDINNLQLIGSTSGSSTQYTDFTAPAGYIFYQIEVISPIQCNDLELKTTQATINSSRSNIATNSPTGFETNIVQFNSLTIFPNPFDNKILIESKTHDFINGTIEIINLYGEIIKYVDIKSVKTEINTYDLDIGLYILKIKTEKGVFVQKTIKY